MKYVRLDDNGKVIEILPQDTYGAGIAYWYGQEFASHCVQAPDDVTEDKCYVNGEFIDYTETETYRIEQVKNRMKQIKAQLSKLDIKALKCFDGDITEREYLPFKNQRAELRAEYRQLEAQYGIGDDE